MSADVGHEHVPQLVALAAACDWGHYGAPEWHFLLGAPNRRGWVVPAPAANADAPRLHACVLSFRFGSTDGGADVVSIGMMLVHPEARRTGLARTLLSRAFGAEEARAPVFALVASAMGQPVYRTIGFGSAAPVTKLRLPAALARTLRSSGAAEGAIDRPDASERVRQQLSRLDRSATGLDRGPLLAHLLAQPGAFGAVADADGAAACAAVPTGGGAIVTVGPILAESAGACLALLRAVADRIGKDDVDLELWLCDQPTLVHQLAALAPGTDGRHAEVIAECLLMTARAAGGEAAGGGGAQLAAATLPGARSTYVGCVHPSFG